MVKGPSKERFEAVFAQGKRVGGQLGRLTSLPGTGLVGIATSRKIGGKPQRNRAKRRFREAIRTQAEILNPRLDYVLMIGSEGAQAPFESIQAEVRHLFSEAATRWASDLESS